jgi:hypothetical protein
MKGPLGLGEISRKKQKKKKRQPAPPITAARNKRIAVTEFSSIESKPDAKLPSPREAMLKPAQIIIRKYFLAVLALGTVLPPAKRLSPASGTSGLCVN